MILNQQNLQMMEILLWMMYNNRVKVIYILINLEILSNLQIKHYRKSKFNQKLQMNKED